MNLTLFEVRVIITFIYIQFIIVTSGKDTIAFQEHNFRKSKTLFVFEKVTNTTLDMLQFYYTYR